MSSNCRVAWQNGFLIPQRSPYDGAATGVPAGTSSKVEVERVTRHMTRFGLLLLGVLFLGGAAFAQTTSQPAQSLKPTPSACSSSSQSMRVCTNGLRSCNDVCAAQALSANSQIVGCETSCCTRYNVCVKTRNCGSRVIDCQ